MGIQHYAHSEQELLSADTLAPCKDAKTFEQPMKAYVGDHTGFGFVCTSPSSILRGWGSTVVNLGRVAASGRVHMTAEQQVLCTPGCVCIGSHALTPGVGTEQSSVSASDPSSRILCLCWTRHLPPLHTYAERMLQQYLRHTREHCGMVLHAQNLAPPKSAGVIGQEGTLSTAHLGCPRTGAGCAWTCMRVSCKGMEGAGTCRSLAASRLLQHSHGLANEENALCSNL